MNDIIRKEKESCEFEKYNFEWNFLQEDMFMGEKELMPIMC